MDNVTRGDLVVVMFLELLLMVAWGHAKYWHGISDFQKKKAIADTLFEKFLVWAFKIKGVPTTKRMQRPSRKRPRRTKRQPQKQSQAMSTWTMPLYDPDDPRTKGEFDI